MTKLSHSKYTRLSHSNDQTHILNIPDYHILNIPDYHILMTRLSHFKYTRRSHSKYTRLSQSKYTYSSLLGIHINISRSCSRRKALYLRIQFMAIEHLELFNSIRSLYSWPIHMTFIFKMCPCLLIILTIYTTYTPAKSVRFA